MTIQPSKILIVEDERKIARFIQLELEHDGFTTAIEENGRTALDRIMQETFDVVLLDRMLPGMDGLEVCKRIREILPLPIIMLTAKGEVENKVEGLDAGADDYITKPFAMPELLARIRAALRKRQTTSEDFQQLNELQLKSLSLYPSQHRVSLNGETVELTKKEYDLLEYLLRNKNIVLDRERILQEVWGYEYLGDTNVVDVYIRYLRSKIDERSSEKFIHTVRGVGYVVKE